MDPGIWGPSMWFVVHLVAINYPVQPSHADRKIAQDFYERLGHILPCHTCRMNYQRHLRELPLTPHLDTRNTLVEWTIHLHNKVNQETGKPMLTLDEGRAAIKAELDKRVKQRNEKATGIKIEPAWIIASLFGALSVFLLWEHYGKKMLPGASLPGLK